MIMSSIPFTECKFYTQYMLSVGSANGCLPKPGSKEQVNQSRVLYFQQARLPHWGRKLFEMIEL